MATTGIFELIALGAAPASTDVLVLVDVSDSTQAPQGSTKKMTVANLFTAPTFTGNTMAANINATSLSGGTITAAGASNINGAYYANDSAGTPRRMALIFGTTVQVGACDDGWATDTYVNYQSSLQIYSRSLAASVITVSTAGLLTALHGLNVTGTLAVTGAITATGSVTVGSGTLLTTSASLTAGSTGNSPTITSGPVTGPVTKWISINDNGTIRWIATWT